jgi:predicted RNase H-like nuclease (RuvC/YqgF family)
MVTLLSFLLSCSIGFSQTEKALEGADRYAKLQQRNEQLNKRILELEASVTGLKQELKTNQELLKTEIQKFQEVQAQNERSMNLALDGFTEKFEKQNETVKGVQAELGQKFNNQLLMSALGFVALVVVFLLLNRSATSKALQQNVSHWNQFQEHILKK